MTDYNPKVISERRWRGKCAVWHFHNQEEKVEEPKMGFHDKEKKENNENTTEDNSRKSPLRH